MKNTWIWIEAQSGMLTKASRELITAAKSVSDQIVAVTIDNGSSDYQAIGEYGINQVIVLRGISNIHDADSITNIFSQAIAMYKPSLMLATASDYCKKLMPRFSARANGTYIANITNIGISGDSLICTYPAYGGNISVDGEATNDRPTFLTLRAGSFASAVPQSAVKVEETEFTGNTTSHRVYTSVKEVVQEITEAVDLEAAEIVVTGGRGMRTSEGFALVRELADVLHGAVGATRPAIDEGWASKAHQVGQSGKIVAPKLYIACGVSGAAQHVSAIMGANMIVAINNDEDAPIFSIADIGIVGDALEILPEMIRQISDFRKGGDM